MQTANQKMVVPFGTISIPEQSKRWIGEILRQRMGYRGLVISDDLEMGAIATSLPASQGAQEALAAGADLLLICNNWEAAWESAQLLGREQSLRGRGREAATRPHRPPRRAGTGPRHADRSPARWSRG